MPTLTFHGPSRRVTRKGACPACGKPASRSQVFSASVNPYNKRPDGTPKTWSEVAADVAASAAAWKPGPDEFEHDKCRADRLAPTPAALTAIDPDRMARSDELRRAVVQVNDFAVQHGLPVTGLNLERWADQWRATVGFIPSGEIVMWARAFGLGAVVPIEDGGHCTYVRITHRLSPALRLSVHAAISKPSLGDRLGGAPVRWSRDERTGRRAKDGTVSVDELEAGLLRMGIPVSIPATASLGEL